MSKPGSEPVTVTVDGPGMNTAPAQPIDTGDLRQHVVTGGDGPPLLLVHGWPQTWYA
jgi:pimeloyl-ACP methyl ester carboxylesterase